MQIFAKVKNSKKYFNLKSRGIKNRKSILNSKQKSQNENNITKEKISSAFKQI